MRAVCPGHYQARITRAGGTNRFGGPNFRIAWSQTETFRAGGVWPHDRFMGYREVYAANCSPYQPADGYWMLMEWTAPEDYGGEELYYFTHRDEHTGLLTTGPYPHRGHYKLAVKLVDTSLDEGKLTFHPWPLNSKIVERIIPIIIKAKGDSMERRMRFAREEKLKADQRVRTQMEAVMHDAKRPLLLPQQIDDRIRLMEKQWAKWLKNPLPNKGFQQIPT